VSTGLVCDGPGCTVVETDPDKAEAWWRLERQGSTIDEIGKLSPLLVHPSVNTEITIGGDEDLNLDGPAIDQAEADDEIRFKVFHFHTIGCLAEWSRFGAEMG
jgi:hypothetical protein